jgi:hypothetical protein
VKLARGNSSWGYDRIAGALANLGHRISDQSVGNLLRRHGIPPAPERQKNTTWKDFIRAHRSVLADSDFFTAEVITWHGLMTYVSALWGGIAAESTPRIRITFSRGEESSRQRERALVSQLRPSRQQRQRPCALQGTTGRPPDTATPHDNFSGRCPRGSVECNKTSGSTLRRRSSDRWHSILPGQGSPAPAQCKMIHQILAE